MHAARFRWDFLQGSPLSMAFVNWLRIAGITGGDAVSCGYIAAMAATAIFNTDIRHQILT